MDERQVALADISDSRKRMKEIASQLARRARPDYVKERARAAAMQKGVDVKNRIAGSPLALGILGGLATAGVAKMLFARRARLASSRAEPAPYPPYPAYSGHTDAEEADMAHGKVDRLKHRAGELKDRAKLKAQELGGRASDYAGARPLVTAAGALAVGAAVGLLVPMSRRERRVLESAGVKLHI